MTDQETNAAALLRLMAGKPKLPWYWLLAAALVVAVWSALGAAGVNTPTDGNSADQISYMLGGLFAAALIQSAIVWVLLRAVIARRTGHEVDAGTFGVLLLVAVLSGGVVGAAGVSARTANARVERELSEIRTTSQEQFTQAGQAYLADLAASGAMDVLDPSALRTEKGFEQARLKIQTARAVISTHEARARDIVAKNRARIEVLHVGRTTRRELLAALDREAAEEMAIGERHWALQRSMLDELDGFVVFLQRTKGSWRAVDGRFLFSSETDHAEFKRRQADLLRLNEAAQQRNREAHDSGRLATAQ